MKIRFVEELYDCVTIRKAVVRSEGDLRRIPVIAIFTNYGDKDEARKWARSRSGGWQPIDKFWWVPFSRENLEDLVDLSFFEGEFYAKDSKVKNIILSVFPHQQIAEGVVFNQFSVFPDHEAGYNAMDEFVSEEREELPQMQAYVLVSGQACRVVLHPSEPSDSGSDDLFGNEWRQFKCDDGSIVWACPWIDVTNSSDMGGWPDSDIEGSPVAEIRVSPGLQRSLDGVEAKTI